MSTAPAALVANYDPLLVAFSFAISVAAAYTSLDVAGRGRGADDPPALWMAVAAATMGLGIWSMHFIGMTAFHVGVPITFDVATTLVSLACSIAGAAVALWTVNREAMSTRRWLLGTALMGATLGAMHYLGMAAMRMQAYVAYDPFWFAMSGVVAMGASGLALWLAFRVRGESLAIWSARKLGSAIVLGAAIAGMHYTGMAAATFFPAVCATPTLPTLDVSYLGVAAIACTTLFVMAGSVLSAYKANLHVKQADLEATSALNAELQATAGRLRASEERYRDLADAMPGIVWTAEPNGDVDYFNARWREYTGLDLARSIGWGWQLVVHPADLGPCLARWREAIATGGVYEVEYRFRRGADAAYRWHLGRALPARDAQGRITKWYGSCTDIHERKQVSEAIEREVARRTAELAEREEALRAANAALREADRYKDEFLSVISHELRTPLNFITGFASTLEDEVQGPLNDPQRAAVSKILNGADRMLLLVDDLLDFAKMQSGKFELAPRPTRFGPLVSEALALLAPLAAQKGLLLTAEPGDDATLPIDPARVTQVLTNLLSNAIKFTDQGVVAVRTHVRDGMLVTEVRDQGCGIAPAHVPRLFQRFAQLDMSNTRRAGGTGLGLAISKALVEAHGGTIGVASELGVGTTVWFALPLAPAPAGASAQPDLAHEHAVVGDLLLEGPALAQELREADAG